MTFKMIKPFVAELIAVIIQITVVVIGLLKLEFVVVSFRVHLLSITAIIFIFGQILFWFSRIVNTGVRALKDFVMQSVKEDHYIFLWKETLKASELIAKLNRDGSESYVVYYLIHAKKDDKTYTFLSPKFIEMNENESYLIRTGKSSKIVLEVKPLPK